MKIKNWDNIKEGTLLLVVWHDIIMDSSWTDIKDIKITKPPECKDIGWFINHDDLNIRISNSINSDGEASFTLIPKGCIRDVRKISY